MSKRICCGVEGHAAVHGENRRTLECARKGSAAIAPSVTRGPCREGAAGIKSGQQMRLLMNEEVTMNHTLSQRQTLRRHRENLDQVTAERDTEVVYKATTKLMRVIVLIALVVACVLSAQGVV
jgi:hypothetical protein